MELKTEEDQFVCLANEVTNYISNFYRAANDRGTYIEERSLHEMLVRTQPLPDVGIEANIVLKEVLDLMEKGLCNVQSSGYYGYISSRPILLSVIGDYLASALNQTAGAWRAGPAATVIENQTLRWIADFVGYSTEANQPSGIITNGGTMANATALKLARDIKLGRIVQDEGLNCRQLKPTVYLSDKGHFSISKSLDFLGLGKGSLRIIRSTDDGKIDIEALESVILRDVERGCLPICLIGTAGTTSTGAIDDLSRLSTVANSFDMWFHVDAASAGVYADHPETKKYFKGFDQAHSVTIDPCKWLFLPFGIGCLLLKEPKELFESFKISADYWEEKNDLDFFQMSFPGTRQWRSLGLWMAFKGLGKEGFYSLLSQTLELKKYLIKKIQKSDNLELLGSTKLPITCFRLLSKDESVISSNKLNRILCGRLNHLNDHYVTLMDDTGVVYLRIAFSNPQANFLRVDSLIENLLDNAKGIGAI